jgi:glycosyltransferase involved in cell wall biosynthesis
VPEVILPVLDEADAIPLVLANMPRGYEPLVVDNGSTDGSAELARSFGARVLIEPRRGFGAACCAGLVAARDDIVCFMDCDGSLDPRQLPLVADPVIMGELDLVLGTRRRDSAHLPAHARVANALLAREIRRRTGREVSDLGPMRAARREDLLRLGMRDRRFGWPLEMVLRAAAEGWRIGEVPVSYRARVGRSKVTGTWRGSLRATRDMTRVLLAPTAPTRR